MAVAQNILAGEEADSVHAPVPFIWTDQYELTFQIHGLPEEAEVIEVIEGSHDERELVVAYGGEGQLRAAIGVNSPAHCPQGPATGRPGSRLGGPRLAGLSRP